MTIPGALHDYHPEVLPKCKIFSSSPAKKLLRMWRAKNVVFLAELHDDNQGWRNVAEVWAKILIEVKCTWGCVVFEGKSSLWRLLFHIIINYNLENSTYAFRRPVLYFVKILFEIYGCRQIPKNPKASEQKTRRQGIIQFFLSSQSFREIWSSPLRRSK